MHPTNTPPRAAFTLVELAIVLVIIGLIVGGVLVGQDLIHAAQIRSVVTDIERYNAAAVTFREKYTGLPGDLLNTKAVQFGFNTDAADAARHGVSGMGDGDGILVGCVTITTPRIGCETALFWTDLSVARLIPFRSKLTSITATPQDTFSTAELADGVLPKTKLRESTLFTVFSAANQNFFGIGQLSTEGGDAIITVRNNGGSEGGLTPLEALAIDQKLDDGEPTTGGITTFRKFPDQPDDNGGQTGCIAPSNHYNTLTDIAANVDGCALSVRVAF